MSVLFRRQSCLHHPPALSAEFCPQLFPPAAAQMTLPLHLPHPGGNQQLHSGQALRSALPGHSFRLSPSAQLPDSDHLQAASDSMTHESHRMTLKSRPSYYSRFFRTEPQNSGALPRPTGLRGTPASPRPLLPAQVLPSLAPAGRPYLPVSSLQVQTRWHLSCPRPQPDRRKSRSASAPHRPDGQEADCGI